jgi:hypothetical protein
MTTIATTQTPTVDEDAATALAVRSRLAATALVLAGVCLDVGHSMSINPHGSTASYIGRMTDHHVTGVVGGLLLSAGAFLLLPGLVAILSLVRGRGAALATAGAVLTGVGAATLGAGDVMNTLVMGALVKTHPDLASEIYTVANGDTAPLAGLPFAFAPLFVFGLVIVAVALGRARTVPVWLAVLLGVGALLIFFSSGGGLVSAGVPTLPLAVALVLLGVRALRR